MSEQFNQKVSLCFSEQRSEGEVLVLKRNRSETLKSAIISALIMLLVTIVMAFIPLAHFILVPLGLIATVIIFVAESNKSEKILSGSGTCPACKKEFKIMSRNYRFPFADPCSECSRLVRVEIC